MLLRMRFGQVVTPLRQLSRPVAPRVVRKKLMRVDTKHLFKALSKLAACETCCFLYPACRCRPAKKLCRSHLLDCCHDLHPSHSPKIQIHSRTVDISSFYLNIKLWYDKFFNGKKLFSFALESWTCSFWLHSCKRTVQQPRYLFSK